MIGAVKFIFAIVQTHIQTNTRHKARYFAGEEIGAIGAALIMRRAPFRPINSVNLPHWVLFEILLDAK